MSDDIAPQTDSTEPEPIGLAGLAPVETLGQHLAAQAQQMAVRRVPARPWLHALSPVLGRLAALPAPEAERFRRVELGAEPLRIAPRVRSSRDDAGTEGIGFVAGTAKSSAVAPIDEHTLLAPDLRLHDTIRPSVSSVAEPGVEPTGEPGARAEQAPLTPEVRVRDAFRPSLGSIAGPGVEPAGEMGLRAQEAPLMPEARVRDTIRPSVSSVAGSEPARATGARAQEAPLAPEARVRDTIQPSVSSVAGSAAQTVGDRDASPEGLPVPPDVHLRLRDLVGPTLPAMRIRDDVQADAVARNSQADAVTVGNQVLFRAERYRPYTPQGLALLAHEAVHAGETQQPNVAWQRATAAGRAAEERQALDVERATLRSAQSTSPGAAPGAPLPLRGVPPGQAAATSQAAWSLPAITVAEGAGSPAAVMQPMAAATGRDLEAQPAPSTPAPSFQELREALYRDLMRQLRADFERGG